MSVGGVAWVLSCLLAGYWFGSYPVVKDNFEYVLIAIVAISILPMGIELLRARRGERAEPATNPEG